MSLTTLAPSASAIHAADALDAARDILQRDWTAHPDYYGMGGTLRSHRGHRISIRIDGTAVNARVRLEDDTVRRASATAANGTSAALGKAIADMVTGTLEDAYAAVSRTRLTAAKVACVAPDHARTFWLNGEAVTHWTVPGSYAEVQHRTKATEDDELSYPASNVSFRSLTVEQALTVLRAIRTDNRDPRRKQPTHGPLAEIQAAVPDLRPADTFDRYGYGLTTQVLRVDGTVEVLLNLLRDPTSVDVVVWGPMDNQLRAIAAL
ncbi:hypothetical protein [Streptomyces sp. NPDC004267]|uniref:hypothetical protein n=1 Tax=Streptomyces sp. NPDC004267 TaxID=3364694 RepID=UPI003687E928